MLDALSQDALQELWDLREERDGLRRDACEMADAIVALVDDGTPIDGGVYAIAQDYSIGGAVEAVGA